LWVVYSCYLTPEAQVKRALVKAKKAVENEDYAAIEDFFVADFADQFGFDKATWMGLIQSSLAQWKDVDINLLQIEIEVDGKQAQVHFHARGEATRASSLTGDQFPDRQSFGYKNIRFWMIKEDGRWRLKQWSNINSNLWQVPMPPAGF